MAQRVNIQYSINLDDLPTEVDRIFRVARQQLLEITLPQEDPAGLLDSATLKGIAQARRKLASLDHVLNDLSGIISSYVEYEIAQLNQREKPTGQTNAEDSPSVP
tara:strand:+ start:1112 stop:1426 length:315 start_codon:yes stop_codon:yes gene_type:complete